MNYVILVLIILYTEEMEIYCNTKVLTWDSNYYFIGKKSIFCGKA